MLSNFQTLRVAVLCSRRAPGLDVLLHHPHRRSLFDLACVVTTETDFADRDSIEAAGVPVLIHPIHVFHGERQASIRDLTVRRDYDTVTAEALKHLGVNVVLLLSYLFILTDPMLKRFEGRIFSVHDSDLSIDRPDGKRKYVGLHSTRDAIVAGEKQTRSSVHIVNREVDGGPIVLMSDPLPVAPFASEAVIAGANDVVSAYAYAHREWMMRSNWGALLIRALEHISAGMETLDLASAI
jgi:folate-dependent phosphoribosylglycinamide formyltransferase PurN